MRFGLRCIFVLSIVYGAILSHDRRRPALVSPARIAGVRDVVGARLAAGVEARCRRDPSACLVEAARLGHLLQLAGAGPSALPADGHRDRDATARVSP